MNGQKQILVLRGELLTPIVTKRTQFKINNCKASITKPHRRYYTKINASKSMYPYSYVCYLGTLVINFEHQSFNVIIEKMKSLIKMTHIGKFHMNGMGKIQWKGGIIRSCNPEEIETKKDIKTKLRIRKGLPSKLTKEQQQLLKYALLHDFYHTSIHRSKIYQEPQLTDQTLVNKLQKHHEMTLDPLIKQFQYYDRLAASITRKIRSPVNSRYNWKAKKSFRRIDFIKLAKNIQEVAETNIWNLYRYIYESKELNLLNESMNHGHTTLKNHLLVITNLIVQDFRTEGK